MSALLHGTETLEVTVRQPSGASFVVRVDERETSRALKVAIAVQIKVAIARQRLMHGVELLPDAKPLAELSAAGGGAEVLLVISSTCDLVTGSRCPLGIWDSDRQIMERPVLTLDSDLKLQDPRDAMRLADGELYTLLYSMDAEANSHCVQLWQGVPGSCVRRLPLSARWLDEYVHVRFSPDGAFVIANCLDYLLFWDALTGEVHRCGGAEVVSGVIRCMQQGLALISSNRILQLLDYHSGSELHHWTGEDPWASSTALLSHSGHWVAEHCYGEPMKVWNFTSSPRSFADAPVACASFSPDEKEIAVVYREGPNIAVIRLSDGKSRDAILPATRFLFHEIGFSADASVLYLAESCGRLHRWALNSMELLAATPEPPKDVMKLGLCGDGLTFFRSDRGGRVELLHLLSGSLQVV